MYGRREYFLERPKSMSFTTEVSYSNFSKKFSGLMSLKDYSIFTYGKSNYHAGI